MPLTTEFVPLAKLAAVVVPSILATSAMYEYFRVTHPHGRTLDLDWVKASHDLTEHKERQACPEPVVMDPFKRAREHERHMMAH